MAGVRGGATMSTDRRREAQVIPVTRLDGQELLINAELIERLEATPETVITLTNSHRLVVRESTAVVAERVLDYRRRIAHGVAAPAMPDEI